VTSDELRRWLKEQGCTFGTQSGSHLKVYRGGKRSIIPIHGAKREIKTGTVAAIKKQLGLK
jgi:mRNA interferase HicA